MTIASNAERKAGPFVGNGVTTVFPFAFKCFSALDISVRLLTTATGAIAVLVKDDPAGYTVALNADQNANPGGAITYNPAGVPLPATQTLTIAGDIMQDVQGIDLVNAGPWLPQTVEDMVDRAVIAATQARDSVARAMRVPPTDAALADLPSAVARANKFPFFDAAGVLTLVSAVSTVGFLGAVQAGQVVFGSAGGLLNQDAGFVWDNVNKRAGINTAVPTVPLDVTGSGKFSTSVVTPLVASSGALLNVQGGVGQVLQLGANANTMFQVQTTGHLIPISGDATQNFGDSTHRILNIFTSAIDSGTTGSLSLKTNNGTEQVRVTHIASGVNRIELQGGSTGNGVRIDSQGTDTDVPFLISIKGAGQLQVNTNSQVAPATQFQVLHTASATRNITITGSNGGNPTINVTGGNLAITPTLILTSGVLDTGSTGSLSLKTNNGTEQFRIGHTASSVNFWSAYGGAAAGSPNLYADGSDTNISPNFSLKGAGTFTFATRNDAGSKTQFQILDTAGATRNITVTGSNGGNPILGATGGGVAIVGTPTNDNALTGQYGEYIESNIPTGSSVALTTNTPANVTSITLGAGDWDVEGAICYTFGATTSYTNLTGGVSLVSLTLGAQVDRFDFETPAAIPTATADATFPCPKVRLTLTGSTTIFLVASSTFTVSTLKAYGKIRARRVR